MKTTFSVLRRRIGMGSFALGLAFIVWLALGILRLVPLLLEIPGESLVRTHAAIAVACLLVGAWGYWRT